MLVYEMNEEDRQAAMRAFEQAHKAKPDLGFAPDRAWIEGWAFAQHPSQSAGDFVPPHCDPDREDVFAEPTSQSAGEPVAIFSKGPWLFRETGQEFSGADLDAAAFAAYRDRLTSPPPTDAAGAPDQVARIVHLRADREKRIYIAGPMTGLPEFNFPAFNAKAVELRAEGWHVENPAEHGHVKGARWADYLRWDISRIVTCGAIYLLPGWETSKGAQLEVYIGKALGLTFLGADAARASGVTMERDPLSDFQEGQWWVAELDAMVKGGTADEKRAVAVVHRLLRACRAVAEPDAARVEADRRDAALGHVALRFVDRAGDPVSGIDDAGTILREFYEAMTAALAAERKEQA